MFGTLFKQFLKFFLSQLIHPTLYLVIVRAWKVNIITYKTSIIILDVDILNRS